MVLGSGLILGAFTNRFLAENFYHALPGLNSPYQTALFSLMIALALLVFWRLYSAACARRGQISLNHALADDALTYTPLFLLLLYLVQRGVNPLQAKALLGGCLLLVTALKVKVVLIRRKIISQRWVERAIPLGLFALTFAVYLSTLSPTVGEADSFEFQVVSYTLGIAHPSGYPLYILLGKLATLLPVNSTGIGNVAYRVNLISPLFASLAVVCLYLCLMRLIRRHAISLLAALTFAFSRTFWSQAVIAEVYTLNAFFVALVLYLLLKARPTMKSSGYRTAPHQWGFNPATSEKSPIHRALLRSWATLSPSGLIAFFYGLSLTNHITMALLAPGMAIYALLTGIWKSSRKAARNQVFGGLGIQGTHNGEHSALPRDDHGEEKLGFSLADVKKALAAAGCFLLGLSVYLYLPLRWPALHDGRSMTLSEFAHWVLGSRFRGALHWDAWLKPDRYLILDRLLLEQYGWVGVALGLLGLAWLFAKRRREAAFLLVAYVTYFIYGLCYYVPDVAAFIIPAHLIFALWIGAGLHMASQQISKSANLLPRSSAPLLLCSLVALLPLSQLWTNLPQVDMSHHGWDSYRWGQYVLELDLARGAAILADSEKIAPLYYLQRVEGLQPDLDIVVMGDEAGYRQQLEARLAQGQTVYLARYLPGLEGRFHLRSLGPLVEVGTTPLTQQPPIEQPLSTEFGSSIRLLGYDDQPLTIEPPGHLRLTLFWQAVDKVDANYHVRLRLVSNDAEETRSPELVRAVPARASRSSREGPQQVGESDQKRALSTERDESGHVWLEEEGRHPVNGYYPTVAWRPGEIVPDFHELAISQALPPGTYRLEVGLSPPFSQESVWSAHIGRVHILGGVSREGLRREGLRWESPADFSISYPLRAIFSDELILLGYDRPRFARPNGSATLTLYWQRLREGAEDYYIALQLADEAGSVLWQEDAPPLFGQYPTSRWGVGQIVQTSHDLAIPSIAGEANLLVGLRLPASGEMLPVRRRWLAPLSEWCPLRPIQVRVAPVSAGPAINFDNKILLLEYDLDPRQLRPGQTLELSLTWQCLQRMDKDYTVFVHIIDEQQRIWGQEDIGPVHGTYPTSQWKEGEIIEDTHSVQLSYEAPPGEYQIEVGFYLLSTMTRLPVLDEEMKPVDDKAIIETTK